MSRMMLTATLTRPTTIAAAGLTVTESEGCRFHRWKPFPAGPVEAGVASDDAAGTERYEAV